MMTRVVIPKGKMQELYGSLMKDFRLVVPVKEGATLLFKPVSNVDDIILDDDVTYKSPKEFLFPQIEQIMTFGVDGEVRINEDAQKTIIFGIRPCDLEALQVMSAVFTKGKFVDTYFEKKMENTILVGFGCKSDKKGCFCSDRGVDKGYSNLCDIFLNDCEENYIAESISARGEQLLKTFGFDDAAQQAVIRNKDNKNALLEINTDEMTLFNNVDWDRISEKCIACGTCTYICPTCHCFDFKDVVEKGEAVRYKCWDSCMYPKFTVHASGHNPRSSKKERYRQRIMHKYHYVRKNFGYIACTGCGRCIRSCPAGMNIKSVVTMLRDTP